MGRLKSSTCVLQSVYTCAPAQLTWFRLSIMVGIRCLIFSNLGEGWSFAMRIALFNLCASSDFFLCFACFIVIQIYYFLLEILKIMQLFFESFIKICKCSAIAARLELICLLNNRSLLNEFPVNVILASGNRLKKSWVQCNTVHKTFRVSPLFETTLSLSNPEFSS